MPDQKFHKRGAALSLKEIASLTGAKLSDNADPDSTIEDVAPLDTAGKTDLSFLDNPKYRDQLKVTKAGACFVREDLAETAPKGINLLITAAPYRAYALTTRVIYPQKPQETRIAKSALIDPSVKLGKGCWIDEGAVIRENVVLGDNCRVGSNAVISHAIIGNNVYIYPGVCIGQDGFGFVPDAKGHIKIPQLGRVIIEDNVEIGANSTIDRGSGPDTIIGAGTWIDNLVQVAHNVKIGKGCIIAAQCGISGSTIIEDFVAIGGQVGLSGHLRIGKGARIAAKSGVTSDIPPGGEYMGYPARPMRQYLKGVALLNRLIKREKSS
jgi:UDP-3-O-[3-hydroxymyristoyl] glucosamine N-acyltransferase